MKVVAEIAVCVVFLEVVDELASCYGASSCIVELDN